MKSFLRGFLVVVFSLLAQDAVAGASTEVSCVAWKFHVPARADTAPFLREIDAAVAMPDGTTLTLPAFYTGGDIFEVRARASQAGSYAFAGVHEAGKPLDGVVLTLENSGKQTVEHPWTEHGIAVSPTDAKRFVRGAGVYIPVGANLPYTSGEPKAFYARILDQFRDAGLNWARVWMAHWNGTNLDWSSRKPPLARGELDLDVASTWDVIVSRAEADHLALQIVLQHHGQLTTTVNPNWEFNPWNAALPGGFLATPRDFFTDEQARRLTKAKYRYIVARWGYSTSIMAWELFNEVSNIELYFAAPEHRAAIAAWHSEMARYLRSVDVYHHLVTTSCEDLDGALYQEMDYYQPHCYATNMLAGPRRFLFSHSRLEKPVFYGECGDDQLRNPPEVAASGAPLLPPLWSGLMGESDQPPQLWYVERLLQSGKIGELTALVRFIEAARLAERDGLSPFNAATTCAETAPLLLEPSLWWQRHAPVVIDVPLDGREPDALAFLPKTLVGNSQGITAGFPHKTSITLDFPRATCITVKIEQASPGGGHVELAVDGQAKYFHDWLPQGKSVPKQNPLYSAFNEPVDAKIAVDAGRHTVEIRNERGPDWIQLGAIDLGLTRPALGAVGRRNESFAMFWVWNRNAAARRSSVHGSVLLDHLSAGRWRLVWWDTQNGTVLSTSQVDHAGGPFEATTPEITHHAAAFLEKL